MSNIIAVYGTLRYGESANGLMKGCRYLGKDHVRGKLYSLGSFPALKRSDEEADKVVVDLYKLPNQLVLQGLDRYEGYYPAEPDQSLYKRVLSLTEEGNAEVWVYEYVFEPPENSRIKNGDWSNAS